MTTKEWLKKKYIDENYKVKSIIPGVGESYFKLSDLLDQFHQSEGWVSVENRMPPNIKLRDEDPFECKLILDTDEIVKGYYADNTWWIELGGMSVGNRDINSLDIEVKVLYWQELPEPPIKK